MADRSTGMSRREMLAAGAALPVGLATSPAHGAPMADMQTHAAPAEASAPASDDPAGHVPDLVALETLSALEMEVLDAVCARLIPSDERGPGAREARAAHYIDRALGGALAGQRGAYAAGLSALDAFARSARSKPFAELAAAEQDAVLRDVEAGKAPGFAPSSAAFFAMVRGHTIEGMFCDPYYGGNANFVGWDLLGYPGIRMMVEAEDQRFAKPAPLRQSAYSNATMFGRGGG